MRHQWSKGVKTTNPSHLDSADPASRATRLCLRGSLVNATPSSFHIIVRSRNHVTDCAICVLLRFTAHSGGVTAKIPLFVWHKTTMIRCSRVLSNRHRLLCGVGCKAVRNRRQHGGTVHLHSLGFCTYARLDFTVIWEKIADKPHVDSSEILLHSRS